VSLFFRAFILAVLLALAAAVIVAASVLLVIAVIPVDGPAVQTVPATQTPVSRIVTRQ
jgi:hypothetical protein